MLQMAKLGSYDVLPTITLTSTPLDMIEAILTKAVDQYVVIADAGNWNVPKGRGGGGGGQHALAAGTATKLKCWNCGKEGCNVKKCKEPKNEARIKKNRDKFYEQKRAQGGGSSNGNNSNRNADKSSADYQRKQWESNGLTMVGKVLKCQCNTCGPNFTHTSRHHNAWVAGRYKISESHPLFTFNAKLGNTVPKDESSKPPPQNNDGGNGGSGSGNGGGGSANGGGGSANWLPFSRDALESKLSTFECNSTDPNASSVASAIRELLLN